MMRAITIGFFQNFSLAMFLLALIAGVVNSRRDFKDRLAESLFCWTALLALGITGVYTFIMHAYFPSLSAAAIGWATSPFQYEVAVANLAVGVLGLLAFRASYDFRLATTVAASVWLWGDAIGHIYQMARFHNFSSGNAGSWFWIDVVLPIVLWWSLLHIKICKLR